MKELLDKISALAGDQRRDTFRTAAEWVLTQPLKGGQIVETGCYRGISGDGHSTAILSMLAEATERFLYSFELSAEHIALAKALLKEKDISYSVRFCEGDSLATIPRSGMDSIFFAYLDSFDHDPANPGPCQRHQLAELGCIIGSMTTPGAILMDDNIPETGGKTKLAAVFLEDRGWVKKAEGYQLFYVHE